MSAKVMEVDDSSFEHEVLGAKVPVLVEFTAQWCGPCRTMARVVAEVADEAGGKVKVVVIDTDASPRTTQRYGIRGVPSLLVFNNGQKTGQHVGATNKARVQSLLAQPAVTIAVPPSLV